MLDLGMIGNDLGTIGNDLGNDPVRFRSIAILILWLKCQAFSAPFVPVRLRSAMPYQILQLILIGQAMARPFAAPPGIPADRKAALIAAFERTTKDPDFLAEAEKLNFEVNPVSADKLDALLAGAATPKDVIAKAAKAMSD